MKKIRVTESELIELVKRIIKEDAQNAYFTQKVTGQETPHDEDDMAPDGMGDDSNESYQVESELTEEDDVNTFNVDEETGIEGLDDAGSALDTMSYTNPDASGFQSQGPMDSYGGWDDEAFISEQKVDLELPTNSDVPVPDTNDDKISPAMTHDEFMNKLDDMCPEIIKTEKMIANRSCKRCHTDVMNLLKQYCLTR
jgi:hypothetical protein